MQQIIRTFKVGTTVYANRVVSIIAGTNNVQHSDNAFFGVVVPNEAQKQIFAPGDTVEIQHLGLANIELSATITKGDYLKSNSTGHGLKATDNVGTIGMALESGISGDIIAVFFRPKPYENI